MITAIIAGIVCALFGGTPLAVSGPAAVMTLLIADIIEKHGFPSLMIVGMLAGLMQLLSGILGIGKVSRYIPLPVIAGFTAGIGVMILIAQIPHGFGLAPPFESTIYSVLHHFKDYVNEMNKHCLLVFVMTIGIIRWLPTVLPKIPPILAAVVLSASMVHFLHLNDVPLIGAIPSTLPTFHLPTFSNVSLELVFSAFIIYVLASLETLLSCTAIDKITNGPKHNSNQELIGQGLGNIIVSFFGGMPVTNVITRSALNVKAGAKTRRASLIHAFAILFGIYQFSSLISLIPIATLAGILVSIALTMISYKEIYHLWISSPAESIIYGVTLLTIIFVDLMAGVQAGILTATLIVLWKAASTYYYVSTDKHENIIRFALSGTLTFLTIGKIVEFENKIKKVKKGKTVILDLSDVTHIDTSGANAVCDLYQLYQINQIHFYIKGLSKKFETMFRISSDKSSLIDHHYLIFDHELKKKNQAPHSSRARLIYGVNRFYQKRKHNDKRLFDYISNKQTPHTLFITCADSRITPSQITSTDPGELFTIRNVGNFIPPYDDKALYSEMAAIEFALSNFEINDIIICGHTNCGAIHACKHPACVEANTSLTSWIDMIRSQLNLEDHVTLNDIARKNVLNQVNNLKQYPIVQEKIASHSLTIHAWFFDFEKNLVYEWDHKDENFKSLMDEKQNIKFI